MDSVKVAIRIRPLIARERGSDEIWCADTHQIQVKDGRRDPYVFDRVFGSDETTSDVYEEIVEPIVESAMTGFNGTVFAYGQTSSGKTYTMMGGGSNPGIIPLSVRDTFAHIQKTPEREFLLRVCYMEIYNEVVRDLLVSDASGLQIREDEFRNAVVQGLTEKVVGSEDEVLGLIRQGDKRRHTGCTNMNERSSRSHTIFRMILESRERIDPNTTKDSVEFDTAVKISQLNLVDLAGSERAHQAGTEGQRFKEGCHINKSLSTLGLVINQICKASETGQSAQFISYRDSKLTRILQPSLGGNALTAIICAVTPVSYDDTDSTLRFASNAKKIKNKPHVNEVLSDEALLYRQKREINQLKKRIRQLELNAGKEKNEELETMLVEKEKLQKEQEERIAMLKNIILVSTQPVDNAKRQRNTRRETWCPGKLKAATTGAIGSPSARDMNFINQSSFFHLDQNLLGVEFEPMVKRTKYSDTDLLPIRSVGGQPAMETKSEANAASQHFATLEDELILIRSQHEELEEDLRTARLERDNILRDKEADKLKMLRMQEELDWQKENLNEVFDEKTLIETENNKLQKNIQELNSRISDLVRKEKQWLNSNPETSSLKEFQNELQQQLSDVCSQNCRLQLKNDEDRASIRQLQSKLENITTDLKEKEESLEEYKNQVSSLQSQLDATFAGSKNRSSLSAHDVDAFNKTRFENMEAELKEKRDKVDRLTQELADKIDQGEIDEILDQLEKQTSENCHLKRLIEDLKKEKDVANTDLKSHVDEAINESFKIGEKTFRECVESCEEMAEKNNKLTEQVEVLQKENNQLKVQMEGKFGENTMMNAVTEYDELMQEKETILRQVVELKEEIKALNIKDVNQKQRIQSLTEHTEFIDMEKEICLQHEKELEKEISSLKDEMVKYDTQIVTLQSRATDSIDDAGLKQDTDIKLLREENETLRKSSVDAQAMLQEANKKCAIANTTVETQQKELETLRRDLTNAQSDLDSFNSMAEITKQKYEQKLQELSQQLQLTYDQMGDGDGKPDEIQIQIGEIEEYKVRLGEKDSEIDGLKKKLADSLTDLEKLQSSIQNSKVLHSEESTNRDLKNASQTEVADTVFENFGMNMEELKKKIAIIDDLQKQCDTLVSEQLEKSARIQSLEESLKMKDNQIGNDDLRNKISEMEEALKDRNTKLEELHCSHEEKIKELENIKATLQENEIKFMDDVEKLEKLQHSHDEKEEAISKLEKELEEATSKRKEMEKRLDEVSDSTTDDEKKLRELLTDSRKDLAEMTEKYERLNTITQHAHGALLAETNRDLDHQRQLQISESQRRESQLEMANERESANKQITQLLSKVSELQMSLSRTEAEKDIAFSERTKATEECEFLRQQVKTLESAHRDEGSIVPRGQVMDPEKMAQRIKRLSANLEYANQIQEKLKTTNASLTDDNKKLQREAFKVMELEAEVGKLNNILQQEHKTGTDTKGRFNKLQQEASSMRERIVDLGKQLKEAKDQRSSDADKLTSQVESFEEDKQNLQSKIDKSENRIRELNSKINELSQKNEENLTKIQNFFELVEELQQQLQESKVKINEGEKFLESMRDRVEHSSRALDEEKKKNTEIEENHSLLMADMRKISDKLDERNLLVNELKEKNDLLLQSVESMKAKLNTKYEEIENVRNESSALEESERILQNVRDKLNDVENERDSYITKISELKEAFEEERSQKDEAMKDLSERLSHENDETDRKIAELEINCNENEQILEETKLTLLSKIQELEILSDEKKVLEDKVLMLESESENKEDGEDLEKETAYNIVKEQLDEVNREKEILLEKIRELEVTAVLTEEEFQTQSDDAKTNDLTEKLSNLESELETVILDKETADRILEEKIQEHEKAVHEFETMLHEKDEKIKALQETGDEKELLSNELNDLKSDLAAKQKEIEQGKYQLELLKSQNQEKKCVDVSVSEYGIEFSNSFDQEMIDQLYEQVAELKLQLEEKNDVIQGMKLTSPSDTRDEEIENLNQQVEGLKKQLESFSSDIKEKDERVVSLQLQKSDKDIEVQTVELQKAVEDIKAPNEDDDLKMKNIALENKISELQQALNYKELDSETTPDTDELENLRKKTIEQADKNTKLRSLLDTQGEEMACLRKQLLDLGQSLESENGRIVQLKQTKIDAEGRIRELEKRNKELSNLSQANINIDDQEMSVLLEKCNRLEYSLKETEDKLAESMKLLQESDELKKEAVLLKEEKEDEINRLENDLEIHRSQLANLRDCESAMISAKETVLALEQQLEELDSTKKEEIAAMEMEVSKCKNEIVELKETNTNCGELESEIQRLIGENDAMRKSVSESDIDKDAKISALENLLVEKETDFNSERVSFENEIAQLKQQISSLNGDLESVYTMIREKADLMEESASSRETLEKNVEELQLENDALKSRLEKANKQEHATSAELHENVIKAEEKVEELLQNNAQLEKDCESLTSDNEKYKQESVTLEKEIQEAVETIQDLQSELENVKCENESLIEEQKRELNSKRRVKDSESLIASLREEMRMMQETKDSLENQIVEVRNESVSKEEILRKDWEENKKDLEDKLAQSENARTKIQNELEIVEGNLKSTKEAYTKEIEEDQEAQRYLALEISELKTKLAAAMDENGDKVELEKNLEETKGLLYKKELEVQTLQSDIRGWERRHHEDKLDMENAIKLAKDDMAEKNTCIDELTSKLTLAEQMNEKLQNEARALSEMDGSNVDACDVQKVEAEAKISQLTLDIESLKKDHQKELSNMEEAAKADKKQLQAKIDDYEQGLFEQDRDLEEEKAKTETLEKKAMELENKLKAAHCSFSETASSKMKELRQKFDAKLAREKKKYQDVEMELCIEKQRNSQLTTQLEESKHNAGTNIDFARESLAKQRIKESYEEKLKEMEVDFQNKMKERVERMESSKKALNDRISQLEDSCIESEMELEQVKLKNDELNKKLEEQEKSSLNEDRNRMQKELSSKEKELSSKESEVTRLQIQLKSCKEPLERENCQLKEELKLCEDRIDNLKQQVKRAAGGASAERQESVGRITRSSSTRKQPVSQPGVVRESRMYILEMEISDNKHRMKYLEKELAKYKDIEVKRRSENMELLEENKKYRSLIRKAREKRLGSSDVLTENTVILNQDPSSTSGALPNQHTTQQDKCKNQ